MTLITSNAFLPFVGITLGWGLAGAVGERSARPSTLLKGRLANALSIGRSVTVRAAEIAGIMRGANWDRMIWVVAVVSSTRYFIGHIIRNLRISNDQRSRHKNRVGFDKGGKP